MRGNNLVRQLGILATVLGVGAAVGGSPYAAERGQINVNELAKLVAHEDDHVTAVELARWIKERKPRLRVIDIRSQNDFDSYHVPTAERIPLDSLASTGFRPEETVVLYSEGGPHAAQAWVFLRSLGLKNVYFLRGGLYEWIESVMNPTLPIGASAADTLAYNTAAPLSRYFGGMPRSGVTREIDEAIALPRRSGDSTSTAKLTAKIRRRGC